MDNLICTWYNGNINPLLIPSIEILITSKANYNVSFKIDSESLVPDVPIPVSRYA